MRVIFARHGESTANTLHVFSNKPSVHPLTDKGREQAIDLAKRLTGISFAAVYSSDVLRAVETSQIVCEQLGLEFTITAALREFDVGDFEGESDDTHWQQFSQLWNDWYANGLVERNVGGGENLLQIRQRLGGFLEMLVQKYSEHDTILCISHGGILFAGVPGFARNLENVVMRDLTLGNTALVILVYDGTAWNCRQWGETIFPAQK